MRSIDDHCNCSCYHTNEIWSSPSNPHSSFVFCWIQHVHYDWFYYPTCSRKPVFSMCHDQGEITKVGIDYGKVWPIWQVVLLLYRWRVVWCACSGSKLVAVGKSLYLFWHTPTTYPIWHNQVRLGDRRHDQTLINENTCNRREPLFKIGKPRQI